MGDQMFPDPSVSTHKYSSIDLYVMSYFMFGDPSVGGSGFPQKCINCVISVLLGLGFRVFSSRHLWIDSTLLNLHCQSISQDFCHQTTDYRYVDDCTRRCNVLFASSLYFCAIYVYRVTGHIVCFDM